MTARRKVQAAALELLGLFVEDWLFTLAILAWLAAAGLLLPHAVDDPLARAAVFVAGLLGILLERVAAAARAARRDG